MAKVTVVCPACQTALRVPLACAGKKGRCSSCGDVFVIIFAADQVEAELGAKAKDKEILDWLAPEPTAPVAVEAAASPKAAKAAPAPPEPKTFAVHLGHVDDMGAFFLFEPELLYDEDFRLSFPQKCIVCGGRRNLSVHLVIWAGKLPQRGQFGVHDGYQPSMYSLDKLGKLTGRDLLAALDRVQNIPEPYCLPFPYYVCQSCSAVGAVLNDVRFASNLGHQICELGIASLAQAEEFIVAICGPKCKARRQIHNARKRSGNEPWRSLPLAVRSRIRQWYEQQDGEKFIAYIADADFAKTEAGLAGIVVTNRRLVYRKSTARVEMPLNVPITISPKKAGKRNQLQIESRGQKPAAFTAGPAGADRLRRCLLEQGAQAKWLA